MHPADVINGSDGDDRVKFSGRIWTNLVNINRSNLVVNVRMRDTGSFSVSVKNSRPDNS